MSRLPDRQDDLTDEELSLVVRAAEGGAFVEFFGPHVYETYAKIFARVDEILGRRTRRVEQPGRFGGDAFWDAVIAANKAAGIRL